MKRDPDSPFDPVPFLLRWFARHRRDLPWRKDRSLYRVWVAEVMLQQTRVETVVPYYRNFLERFPSLSQLAEARLQDVLKAWEGLGYYARARNLWRAARMVHDDFHDRIPENYVQFRQLPGVGDYIAAAVLSIGRGLALPVVDGNVLRVVSRWQGIDDDIGLAATKEKVRSFLKNIIPASVPGRFNEALMELGALVCQPKGPCCKRCPLQKDCFASRKGCVVSLPVKSKKKPVPTYRVALAVIIRQGGIFIQQRPEKGHLGGLWEFPGGKCRAGETPECAVIRECQEELGVTVEVLSKLGDVRHAYSHFKVHLYVYACRLRKGAIRSGRPHTWIGIGDLQRYPFPAANHKFFPRLTDYLDKGPMYGV